jgi:predicted DNA-binding ribbon-helix-helix protein
MGKDKKFDIGNVLKGVEVNAAMAFISSAPQPIPMLPVKQPEESKMEDVPPQESASILMVEVPIPMPVEGMSEKIDDFGKVKLLPLEWIPTVEEQIPSADIELKVPAVKTDSTKKVTDLKTPTARASIVMAKAMHQDLNQCAAIKQVSVNALVCEVLERYRKQEQPVLAKFREVFRGDAGGK